MNTSIREIYYSLLKEWLDSLLEYQVDDARHPTLSGGILCPACQLIHGRSHEAVYPLLCMADLSGEAKYLDAAKKLFDWGKCMICDDGSFYNDAQSFWNGITVFAALSLEKALRYHAHLLSKSEKSAYEERLLDAVEWIKRNIVPEARLNINYVASGAAALASAGEYFKNNEYTACAKRLGDFALGCVSKNGLLYGEGTPVGRITPRGVRPVDLGYNAEESLPCLYEYACVTGDRKAAQTVRDAAKAHLDFMLPDGAWDNSFGTRNFKWTYWGSRTSDGCQALFNAFGKENPVFAEAGLRNLSLMRKATNGLLHGGPDYAAHGEMPCVHHAFCHAKVLAQALDEGICEFERCPIPSDRPSPLKYYNELDVFKAARGDWHMTVSGGDFVYMPGGSASGGVITLLHHSCYGAVIACANTDFSLKEAHNQQLSLLKSEHKCVCPRVETVSEHMRLSQMYDHGAVLHGEEDAECITIGVSGVSSDFAHERPFPSAVYELHYTLRDPGVCVSGCAINPDAFQSKFVLPLVGSLENAERPDQNTLLIRKNDCVLVLRSSTPIVSISRAFNLAPGFIAVEAVIAPDSEGKFSFSLAVE